jgi:diacylglycerol kinase (ATP)
MEGGRPRPAGAPPWTRTPPPAVHLSLIVNAPSPDAVEALRVEVARLREAGHRVEPRVTFEGGDAARFAAEAAAAGAELVVAAGGDGTVNEVANGLHRWAAGAGAGASLPRVGIVPLGTGNDLAGGLGIPGGDPAAALRGAVEGAPYPVDLARVNGRCFLNVSTGGIGAEATEETSPELKRVLGRVAYLVTGARKFVRLRASRGRFVSGGLTVFEGAFLLFAVGNAWRTGGGNWVTAAADPADRLLDLCIVEEMGHLEVVRVAPLVRAGRHVDHPRVTYLQLPEVTVETEEEITVNADGEPLAGRRFAYSLASLRLTLSVPGAGEGPE